MIRVVVAVVIVGPFTDLGRAAESPAPAEVRKKLDDASALLDEGRPAKARLLVEAAAADLAALATLPRVPSGVRPLAERCGRLKDDLELEGIDVSGITIPRIQSAASAAPAGSAPAKAAPAKASPGISFTRQVAPLLVAHCGGCHVSGRRGDFQMPSYEALMKTGVVQRGVGDSSRLVEVIMTGDMPRGGGRVPPQDLALLVAWINAGAVFDGPDPAAPMGLAAGPSPGVAMPGGGMKTSPSVAPVALKPGDVSFAFQIAPVLQKNCVGCHDDTQPEARLSMTSFARLARGGESGAPFVAGRSTDSLLVRKIKGASGIDGQRMPIGKPALAADVIALVEKWIDQGARLDMLGPDATLADLVAAGRARGLSHAELQTVRFAAAEQLWRRAIPDEAPATARLADVIVVGNLSPARLEEAATSIEKASGAVRELLIDGEGPLLKGGIACYLFAKAYDFSNFRESITREERPKDMAGDAGIAGDVAYGAVIVPAAAVAGADDDLAALAAEQLVAATFLGRGAPVWFARGAGRVVAGKVVPKAAAVKGWRQASAEAVARLGSPEDFFAGHAGPVAQAAIGGGFVAALAPTPAKLAALIVRLDAGTPFDTAFAEVFKSPPQPLFAAWAAKESRKSAGKR